ncbi:MAG: peptidyl-prolyl cis-trans isomerase [Thermodesulfovibrionales bacterium]|jgi:parvulin-like peptidyl-prolyl isomerase
MRKLRVVSVLLLIFATGCAKDAITVDNQGISKELFNYVVRERIQAHKAMNLTVDEKALRKSVSDELIAEALLVEEAKAKNISVSEDELQKTLATIRGNKSEKDFKDEIKKSGISYDLFVKKLKNRLLVSKLMNTVVKDDSITPPMIEEFYKNSQVPLLKPEKDFVRIIEFGDEATAKEAMEKLTKGEDFDALANDLVKSGKASATDYGWLEPQTLSKEISEAMRIAKLNTVYGPLKGNEGYYMFRIKDRQNSGVLSLEEATPQIKNILLNQMRQAIASQIIQNRKKTAQIKINVS